MHVIKLLAVCIGIVAIIAPFAFMPIGLWMLGYAACLVVVGCFGLLFLAASRGSATASEKH